MSTMEKARQRGKRGFSLLELMVVVAILGVLATVAIPRFDIFRARARQGEAKLNLGVIHKLQEAFLIEHEQYYDGDKAKWGGGADMDEVGESSGYRGGGTRKCNDDHRNKLGFRLANCESTRYGFYIAGANETQFLAVAYGPSDQTGDERIYPGCGGGAGAKSHSPKDGAGGRTGGSETKASTCDDEFAASAAHTAGDAWCVDESRNLENYRDIVEYCPE